MTYSSFLLLMLRMLPNWLRTPPLHQHQDFKISTVSQNRTMTCLYEHRPLLSSCGDGGYQFEDCPGVKCWPGWRWWPRWRSWSLPSSGSVWTSTSGSGWLHLGWFSWWWTGREVICLLVTAALSNKITEADKANHNCLCCGFSFQGLVKCGVRMWW